MMGRLSQRPWHETIRVFEGPLLLFSGIAVDGGLGGRLEDLRSRPSLSIAICGIEQAEIRPGPSGRRP